MFGPVSCREEINIRMSKLDNLIGFWNNKSTEVADASKKPRPKSENYDNHSFSRRMEFFDSVKSDRSDASGCDRSEFKDKVKCNDKDDVISDRRAISDVKIIVTNDDDNENNAELRRRDSNAAR